MSTELLIGARTVHFASAAMVAGTLSFWLLVAGPALRRLGAAALPEAVELRARLLRITWISLVLALASGGAWFVLVARDIVGEGETRETIAAVLIGTRLGHVWLARLALILLLAIVLGLGWRGALPAALAMVLLASLAWTGHAGATGDAAGIAQLAADALHIAAAGAWVGGLLPLALLLHAGRVVSDPCWPALRREATRRFSLLGLVSVGLLLATGITNTWFLVGGLPGLIGTDYGRLLLVKIALFAVMIGFAAVNRLRLTPRLATAPAADLLAARSIKRNTFAELGLAAAVLIVVGALGTRPPAAHIQPWWPLPFRFAPEMLDHPTFGTRAMVALAASIAGVVLICTGILVRRFRWLMIGLGIVGATYIPQTLKLLVVEANPTTFHVSPTGYSVRSIVNGKALFMEHCAACHGTDGRGLVPTSEDAKMPPDLTGEHSRGHRDGDLFWWISRGIVDGMPGFGEVLDEPARWSLIDFIHANADAAHVRSFGADDPLRSVPVPEFSCQQPDGSTTSVADLRGRFILVSFIGPDSIDRVRQLAAGDLGPDVTKILVPLGADVPRDSGLCVALAPQVAEAFAMYQEGELAGTELIVDAAGLLRAWGRPAADPTWRDPEKLAQRITAIRQKPALAGRSIPHVHAH